MQVGLPDGDVHLLVVLVPEAAASRRRRENAQHQQVQAEGAHPPLKKADQVGEAGGHSSLRCLEHSTARQRLHNSQFIVHGGRANRVPGRSDTETNDCQLRTTNCELPLRHCRNRHRAHGIGTRRGSDRRGQRSRAHRVSIQIGIAARRCSAARNGQHKIVIAVLRQPDRLDS